MRTVRYMMKVYYIVTWTCRMNSGYSEKDIFPGIYLNE
jgi:hypothetical protein